MKRICKECGRPIEKADDPKSLAMWRLRLCEYCYGMKFPDRKANAGLVIEGDEDDYPYGTNEDGESPYGWLDQFHGSMR